MADFSQANRRLRITTPLGDDALLVTNIQGTEGVSTLFGFDVELVGRDDAVDFDAIVGKNVTLSILMRDGDRYVNGFVSRFAQGGTVHSHASYRAQVVPWLWFLTRTSDCRIFQQKTVPDIVKQIFGEYGFSDFKLQLRGTYPEWDYCVQYRETDYNFVARLLEEEGIFYFFQHEDGKHTLVLADDTSAYDPCPGTSDLRFIHDMTIGDEEDMVTWFTKEQEVRASRYSSTDYNFETPSLDLMSKAKGKDPRPYEHYDYPGAGGSPIKRDRLDHLVRIRQQEEDTARVEFEGGSYTRGLTPGYTFTLAGVGEGAVSHFDGTYLVTAVRHRASESWEPEGDSPGVTYENDFHCIASDVIFRPVRRTPRPLVNGVQTALVVGPSGEEIFVDKYGRVKVQFYWDREGKKDENTTCWIRVSHGWAGKNWGMVAHPRIGQEVIVSFLEGDPDCPIITGRVYNAEQMPPYDLPANKTQTGIKSRSSLKGTPANFNEIRFEDKKGSEQVYIHAEKNEDIIVENDKTENVGHDETIQIGNDRTEVVMANETMTVQKNRTRTVNMNESVTVALMRTHTVGVNEAITIGAAREVTVGAYQNVTVGAAQTVEVGAAQSISVGASQDVSVGGDQSISVGGGQSESVGKDYSLKVGEARSTDVGKDDSLKVGKHLVIDAGDEIVIKTGDAKIVMKKNGDITIEGNNINVKGSGNIVMKGSKIAQN